MRRAAKKKKRACRKKRRGVNPLKRGSIFGSYDPWKGTIFSKGFRKAAPLKAGAPKQASALLPLPGRQPYEDEDFKRIDRARKRGDPGVGVTALVKRAMAMPFKTAEGARAEQLATYIFQKYPSELVSLADAPEKDRMAVLKRDQGGGGTASFNIMDRSKGIEFEWSRVQKDKKTGRLDWARTNKELLRWQDLLATGLKLLKSRGKDRPKWLQTLPKVRAEMKRTQAQMEREYKERIASYRESERKDAARRKLIVKRLTPLLGRKATMQDAVEYVEQDRVREWKRSGVEAVVAGKLPPTPLPPLTLEEFAAFKKGGPKAAEKARAPGQAQEDKKRAEDDERIKAAILSIGKSARAPLEKMLGRKPTDLEVSKVVLTALSKSKGKGRETISVKVGVKKGQLVLPK